MNRGRESKDTGFRHQGRAAGHSQDRRGPLSRYRAFHLRAAPERRGHGGVRGRIRPYRGQPRVRTQRPHVRRSRPPGHHRYRGGNQGGGRRFGIGFKAVFAYTETPRIWSLLWTTGTTASRLAASASASRLCSLHGDAAHLVPPMDYRDNRQRWAESQVVHFYAGQWCTFTPALTGGPAASVQADVVAAHVVCCEVGILSGHSRRRVDWCQIYDPPARRPGTVHPQGLSLGGRCFSNNLL